MSTSLWPALLAAVLGGRQHQHQQQQQEEQQMMMQQERALHPIQALLYLSVLGEHALYWWIGIVCFVALAYATNPSEASFKTHLTDLSFHLHLRRLRAQDPDSLHGSSGNSSTLPGDFRRSSTSASPSGGHSIASSASSATKEVLTSTAGSTNIAGAKINSNATTGGGKSKNTNINNVVNHQAGNSASIEIKQRNVSSSNKQRISPHNHSNGGGAGGVESGRPHVLSFSNRVSISLKTPAYVRTSYALWSTVRILPATPSSSSSSSQSPSASSAKAVGGGSKGSNTTATAGTPGRPILNGVPAVTRRASTTLSGLNERSSKKSSSTSGSGSSSSSSSSSLKNANSRKGKGLVSTVAHGISASLASPVCSPWLEQGGYFIGFLGYWWTVDDGTSFSGAREKLRLGNALLAVEEQDEEDDVSVDQHGPEAARNADDLEGGHSFYDTGHAHSQVARAEDQSNSAQQHMNGSSSNTTTSKRKQQQQQQPSKASHGASMRGGQRRSSPTPRPVSNKKRGSGSGAATAASSASGGGGGSAQASQVNSSGDVTPITPHSTVPLDRRRLEREGHHLLSPNDDSQLPGLPFHVDRNIRDGLNSHAAAAQQDHRQFATVKEGGVNVASGDIVGVDGQTLQGVTFKEGEDGISTISHSASGPESTVATVSPALALLQSQLDDLRTSSAATQARLEAEVEELQIRKRDEDAVRTELKARTKILEESKREAELERLDAEKKLISARSVKKSVEDRVTKARSELSKLEKKEKEVQEKIQRAREERRIKLDSLREDVKKREALLVKEEEATEKLNKRVADLEKEIEERKHDLFQFRREEANAAAVAVTNRMNRAGRGLGPGPHPHTHGHGPHSGAAVTAKRHMHPPPHAHTTAHRHPSQHPNAAVPVAYPYISPEDQAKQSGNQARSSSPGATTPPPPSSQTPATTATGSAANAAQGASSNVEGGQTFGSAFMDHRLQSRRAASAAGTLGGQASAAGANQPVHSNVNTSVIGNSASAAGGLYNRHQLDRGEEDGNELDDLEDNDGDDHDYEARNLVPGSTFAPFGPASPTSPSTIGAPSPREQHGQLNASPGLAHIPYFASDKSLHQASQQPQNRLRMSTSREDFLAAMRSEVVEEDDDHDHHPRELDTTPVMRLASELAEDETDSYVLAKPRAITASGRREAGGRTGGLRRESFDSVGSFTSSNGGPLSPMTPHQASLIPSQLFDMLDDVEMPASPTPFQVAGGMQDPHHTFTQGISDAFDHAGNNDNLQPHQAAGAGGASRRGPGMYSPWADFDIDAGFDFDKPLGYGASASAGVSRKPSGKDGLAHHADLLRRRSGSPIGSGAFDATTSSGAVNSGEGIFASYGPTHGHHGSVGSTGQRSNTSSSGGSISPSLMAATQGHQQQQHQQHSVGNSAMNFPAGFGKLSPNDLLFDKARHVLSLNPDAKAFSFNRPLPSSGSAGSLSSIGGGSKHGGHNLPSNAVGAIGDARLAFDNAGAGSQISSGSGSDSPKLVNNSIAPGNATWASPNLTNRGLHNLGYGTGNTGSSGGNTLRESVRSASGPPLTNPTSSTGHSSSFSPFDDDDLLKGW